MSGDEMAKANGEKIGKVIYEALLACVKRNTADDELLPTMMYLIHKFVRELTMSNEKADAVVALIHASESEIDEAVEQSLDAEIAEDDSTDA